MAKPKTRRKSPVNKSRASSGAGRNALPQIAVGARVRVRSGVWGNSTGTVAGLSSAGVLVRLDTARVMDPIPFDAENLVKGGPMDRV